MPYSEEKHQTLSVSEFVRLINALIGRLEPVWIEGEVIGFKNWKDSIAFFDIKDEKAVLNCSIYYSKLQALGLEIEDGMKIKVMGYPELRAKRGKFNINVRDIKLSGEGAFKKAYELLKKKLEKEGLFEKKKEIPKFVENIGVITSKNGAVIHDFRKNLKKLNFKLFFKDALVEGERSAKSLTRAVRWFNKNMPNLDVLVIMRGGGSMEALQGFNNENLVRAIYNSKIPTICGIGHEVDIPLASLVADISVSTPTAVATHVNQSWKSLEDQIPLLEERLFNNLKSGLNLAQQKINDLKQKIIFQFSKELNYFHSLIREFIQRISYGFNQTFNKFESLKRDLQNVLKVLQRRKRNVKERIDIFKNKILLNFQSELKQKREVISNHEKNLKFLDPERNLELGYSIVLNKNNQVIKKTTNIKKGQDIKTKLQDGSFLSKVKKINKND
jgi:exodeoxyribonuclease VII large subunit